MPTTLQTSDSLAAYQPEAHGGWTAADAAHLLWRLSFGTSVSAVAEVTKLGLRAAVDRHIPADGAWSEESAEFIATEPVLRRAALSSGDVNQLKAWWLYRMRYSQHPLAEKLTLFWHNHFATSNAKVLSVRHMLTQHELIRQHGLGSFRDLLHGMSKDVAMLVWLDSNSNRKRHPNENFARELMELFSLGVGNYTERDIQEAARAFSGWHVRNDEFWFNRLQHDEGSKTVFGRSANFDGGDVVELCLSATACPKFLATKLLQTFVRPRPSAVLVDALAARIRELNFQMTPVLRELFASEAFFAAESRRAIIKSPLELVVGTMTLLGVRPHFQNCLVPLAGLGQDIFEPPTVKGWEGGALWVNSASLIARMNFLIELLSGARFGRADDESLKSLLGNSDLARSTLLQTTEETVPNNRDELLRTLLEPEFQMI
jgi:uncharacterized protein (DUF1800 family)